MEFVSNVRARKLTLPMPFVSGGHCTKELFAAYAARFAWSVRPMLCAASVLLSELIAEKLSDPERPSGESKRYAKRLSAVFQPAVWKFQAYHERMSRAGSS